MLIGKSKAIDFVKINEAPYWRVRRSENSPYVFTALGNASLDESLKRLGECLDYLEPGNYFLECSQKENDNRGAFKTPLRIDGIGQGINPAYPQQMSGIGGITPDEVEKRIADALQRERDNQAMEALKKRNYELELELREKNDELNSFMIQFGKRIEPYVGELLGAFMPKPIPQRIAGIQPKQTQNQKPVNEMMEQQGSEIAARAEAALEKWVETDPDCIDLLEKIVKLSEQNPTMYAQAKSLLNGMVQ